MRARSSTRPMKMKSGTATSVWFIIAPNSRLGSASR